MGKKYSGKLRQPFSIVIDIDKLCEMIANVVEEELKQDPDLIEPEICDIETNNYNELKITGSYDAKYTGEYFAQTLESPAENDMDRPYIFYGNNEDDYAAITKQLLAKLPKELQDLVTITEINEEERDVDYNQYDYNQ